MRNYLIKNTPFIALIIFLVCALLPKGTKAQQSKLFKLDDATAKKYAAYTYIKNQRLDTFPERIFRELKKNGVFLTDKEKFYNPTTIPNNMVPNSMLIVYGITKEKNIGFVVYKAIGNQRGIVVFDFTNKNAGRLYQLINTSAPDKQKYTAIEEKFYKAKTEK